MRGPAARQLANRGGCCPCAERWDERRASSWDEGRRADQSSSSHRRREEKREHSTKRKIEKLQQLAAGLQQELKGLEKERKLAKHAAQDAAQKDKEAFIRKAALLRGQIDEHAEEKQQLGDGIARDQPELEEMRTRLRNENEQMRTRRAGLEQEKDGRLALLREELKVLESLM